MKKICFVTTTPITLNTFVLPLAKQLHKKGVEVTFICDFDEEFSSNLPDYITYIPVRMSRGVTFNVINPIIKLYKIFRNEQYDIVQYSTPNAGLYASIAAIFSKVPIRLYPQWGIRYVGMSGLNRRIFKRIEKLVCSFSTDIRSVSKLNLEYALEEKLFPKGKSKIIGLGGTIGVDLKEFNIDNKQVFREKIRKELKISDEDVVFGFVGRLNQDKGINELLESYSNISSKNTKLLLMGPKETRGLNDKSKDIINKDKSIIQTGLISKENVAQYMSSIDCLIHPTYREGFGMVLQEAGALGIPIITTKIPGASEVLVQNESCLLVEPKSSTELTMMMVEIKDNYSLRNSLGEQALIRVRKYFNRSTMLSNQIEDYLELLEINR